jgi:tRNA threonylcarbamoyladenosine biosynthesis protein TsaE
MERLIFHSESPGDTAALGETLGAALRGGETLALIGDLGAGKTLLTQAVARALGVSGPVPSPTFVLERRHQGRELELRHWDFYRLDENSDLEELGFFDRHAEQVFAVEWPDRLPGAVDPAEAAFIRVEPADPAKPAERIILLEIPDFLPLLAEAARSLAKPFPASPEAR